MRQIVAALAMHESDINVIQKSEELAQRTGAKVTYVHAVEAPFFDFFGHKNIDEDKIKKELEDSVKKHSKAKNINITIAAVKGWELILKTAKDSSADLVILGNMSKSHAVVYMGSTAKKVLEKIGVPVLIARDKPLSGKILIPTDLGEYTMSASKIKDFLKSDSEITYLYANAISFGVTVPYATLAVESLEFVQEEVEKQVEDFRKNRTDAKVVTLDAETVSESVKEYAEQNGYTTIVLASRNLSGLNPIIFGSTASKIAQIANTNLLLTFVE
ncbi:MAG: universal stress protein [Campylobacteraceae bacterium]|jgi:nucleotide-binding universal stress UspA family protein|nr:universal stress protein [Campylobacteraceae bacterium]